MTWADAVWVWNRERATKVNPMAAVFTNLFRAILIFNTSTLYPLGFWRSQLRVNFPRLSIETLRSARLAPPRSLFRAFFVVVARGFLRVSPREGVGGKGIVVGGDFHEGSKSTGSVGGGKARGL